MELKGSKRAKPRERHKPRKAVPVSVFTVSLAIARTEEGPYEELQAMVDTGAFYSWIPSPVLERLGVRPVGVRTFVLATGDETDVAVGYAWVRLRHQSGPTVVAFAPKDSQPLLGAVTLEEFALAAGPVNGRLVPMAKLPAY